jgi:adenosylmethionine-8-amino-7-oxononanoate aminotransferase
VRVSGPNLILSPPLTINESEIDFLVTTLTAAFGEVEGPAK